MRERARKSVGRLMNRCKYSGDFTRALYRASALLKHMNRRGDNPHLAPLAEAFVYRARAHALEQLIDELSDAYDDETSEPGAIDAIAEFEARWEHCIRSAEACERRFYAMLPLGVSSIIRLITRRWRRIQMSPLAES